MYFAKYEYFAKCEYFAKYEYFVPQNVPRVDYLDQYTLIGDCGRRFGPLTLSKIITHMTI